MIRFEGTRDFPQPPALVWARLRDARFLTQCVPDSFPEGSPARDQAVCTVRPSLSFVRGSLQITIQVLEAAADQTLKLLLASKGVGNSSEVEAVMSFAPQNGGTRVQWSAEVVRLGGLLRAVPTGLVRGAAQKLIDDLWKEVASRLDEGPEPTEAS
jgi:carbon monoxide dehydrogenase subunit G